MKFNARSERSFEESPLRLKGARSVLETASRWCALELDDEEDGPSVTMGSRTPFVSCRRRARRSAIVQTAQ